MPLQKGNALQLVQPSFPSATIDTTSDTPSSSVNLRGCISLETRRNNENKHVIARARTIYVYPCNGVVRAAGCSTRRRRAARQPKPPPTYRAARECQHEASLRTSCPCTTLLNTRNVGEQASAQVCEKRHARASDYRRTTTASRRAARNPNDPFSCLIAFYRNITKIGRESACRRRKLRRPAPSAHLRIWHTSARNTTRFRVSNLRVTYAVDWRARRRLGKRAHMCTRNARRRATVNRRRTLT